MTGEPPMTRWRTWRRRPSSHRRVALIAFAVVAVIATALVIEPAARAQDDAVRVVTFMTVGERDGAGSAPIPLARRSVEALDSAAVRSAVAGRLGTDPGEVADRTFVTASPRDWGTVVAQFDGDTLGEAQALRDATLDAIATASPGISLTVRRTTVGRLDPPPAIALLAAVSLVLGAAAAAAIAAWMVASARTGGFGPRLCPPALALATTILLTTALASPLVSRRPSMFAFWIALWIALGAIAAVVARRREVLRLAIPGASALLGCLGAYSAVLWVTDADSTAGVALGASVERRIFPSQFAHPGHYGAALAMLLPFALVGLQRAGRRPIAAAYAAAGALGTVALVLTYARNAWLAFIVSSLVALGTWRARLVALGAGVLVVLPFAGKIAERMTGADYADDARLGIWSQALGVVHDHPLTGVGVRNFFLHTLPEDTDFSAAQPPHAHDLLLNTATEMGLVAALALAALLALVLIGGRRALAGGVPSEDLPVTRAAMASVVALMVAGIFDVAAYQRYTVPLAAIVVGLAASIALRAWRPQAGPGPADEPGRGPALLAAAGAREGAR